MLIQTQLRSLSLGALSIVLTAGPVAAAERLSLTYGPLEFSIPVASLETYAKTGTLDRDLAPYRHLIPKPQQARLRQLLQNRFDLNSVQVSQLLYSDLGARTTAEFGEFIQSEGRQNGFHALRSSIILAAADPSGLTLINALKKYPGTLSLNLKRVQQGLQAFKKIHRQTQQVIALTQLDNPPQSTTTLPNLDTPGNSPWTQQTLSFYDRSRDRTITTDLYLPQTQAPAPVLIFSHSLGTDRANFTDLMQHLASHGFAVLALEHPGSNRQQIKNLLEGRSPEVMQLNEFQNRPLDVTFLLNQLQSNPRLDFKNIGFLGHSLGGYTGLALAGATPNFSQLSQNCRSHLITKNPTNPALVLQCLALKSTVQKPLADSRIRSVFAFNAIAGSIFGDQGLSNIHIPTMLVSGSQDNIAPFITEQLCPFTQLKTPEKHFALMENGTHFYTNRVNNLSAFTPANPDPSIARRYLKSLSLAFAKTYVADRPEYKAYLETPYLTAISRPTLPLRNVTPEAARSIRPTLCP
ncbi:MAG: alpha/beta hydrolase [Alkalinema sp. RU_4_3]|nr:alpha/beta hydrolase [Alkalinema sp. RU_4_3]